MSRGAENEALLQADAGRTPRRRRHLRVLAVQTCSIVTPEVRVFQRLLEGVQRLAGDRDTRVEVLLFQAVDSHMGRERDNGVAARFLEIPDVTVRRMNVGSLGRHDMSPFDRVMKIRDLVRVQLTRRALVDAARSFQPDLVYSAQQLWDLRLATPLARLLRRPQVIHLHYSVGPWLGREVVDILRDARMVIGVSEFIRDDAIRNGVPADRARALYNTVVVPPELPAPTRLEARRTFRHELSVPADSLLVGMTARLNPYKGQEELLEAMLPLLRRDARLQLVLAGEEQPTGNGMIARMRHRAESHSVLPQVHLLGHRSDVPDILDALDVFAHPSQAEPFSLSILEAMAHGLPVVAWREGGPAEIVVHGDTGILVEPGNREGLSESLDRLLADAKLRETMGQRGRTRAATVFHPDVAAGAFLSLLQEAVEREPRQVRGGEV